MKTIRRYILAADGFTPEVCEDLQRWARWMDKIKDIRVAYTLVGDVRVSTVFLGLDHNFSNDGPPVLFETMVFEDAQSYDCRRSSTWANAVMIHEQVVSELREEAKNKPERKFSFEDELDKKEKQEI